MASAFLPLRKDETKKEDKKDNKDNKYKTIQQLALFSM